MPSFVLLAIAKSMPRMTVLVYPDPSLSSTRSPMSRAFGAMLR